MWCVRYLLPAECRSRGLQCAVWGFVALGVLEIVSAFLLGVVYFSIRTLTTSLQHVETIPTYANAILVLSTGILVMFLYKRRDSVLLVSSLVLNLVCIILCATSAVLTGLRTTRTLGHTTHCHYNTLVRHCVCAISGGAKHSPANQGLDAGAADGEVVIYDNAPSCASIQHSLPDLMCTVSALNSITAAIALGTILQVLHVFYLDKESSRMPEQEEFSEDPIEDSQCFEDSRSFHYIRWPAERRRPPLFSRNITLPGINSAIAQQLYLPGEDNARLLRVQRHDEGHSPAEAEESLECMNESSPELSQNRAYEGVLGGTFYYGDANQRRTSGEDETIARQHVDVRDGENRVFPFEMSDTFGSPSNVSRQNSFTTYEILQRLQRRHQRLRNIPYTNRRRHRCRRSASAGRLRTVAPPAPCRQGPAAPPLNNYYYYGWPSFYSVYSQLAVYPVEPPPPYIPSSSYIPSQLPPYVEDDPVPTYRSSEELHNSPAQQSA